MPFRNTQAIDMKQVGANSASAMFFKAAFEEPTAFE
jgi:hypothetical protein